MGTYSKIFDGGREAGKLEGRVVFRFTEIKIIDNSWTVHNLERLNCINFRHITAKD